MTPRRLNYLLEAIDAATAMIGYVRPNALNRRVTQQRPWNKKIPRAVFFTPQVGLPECLRINVLDFFNDELHPWWHIDQGARRTGGNVAFARDLPAYTEEQMRKMFAREVGRLKAPRSIATVDVESELQRMWREQ